MNRKFAGCIRRRNSDLFVETLVDKKQYDRRGYFFLAQHILNLVEASHSFPQGPGLHAVASSGDMAEQPQMEPALAPAAA